MSLESLIDSALKDGAGISLKTVKRSKQYRKRLKRINGLEEVYGTRTHRGIALHSGPQVFGNFLNIGFEAQAISDCRRSSRSGNKSL